MGDLISRQAVIDIIQGELALCCGYDADIALFSVKKCVSELPTAYDIEKVVEEVQNVHLPLASQKARIIGIIRKGGVE